MAAGEPVLNRPSEAVAGRSVMYVVSRYPAVSHAFISSEIASLRRLGLDVQTIGLRRSDTADLLTPEDLAEYERTFALRPVAPLHLLTEHAAALLSSPRNYLRSLRSACHTRRGGRERLRRLGHFAQAVLAWRHCRRLNIRHLHAHFERPAADVAMMAAQLGGGADRGWTWSFTAHSPTQYMGDADVLALKIRTASFVACVSHFGRGQLMSLVEHAQWEKLSVVRCGVDTHRFRRTLPRAERATTVLTVARLEALKGHAVLLDALAKLRDDGISARAVLVGDGPQREALQLLGSQLGIGDRLHFVGSVGQDAISRHYQEADVFCLPSFIEGVPVVLMEAMAMEVPVVASRIMGIPELVEDGVAGLLFPAGSADGLASVLKEILGATADARAALGRAGRDRVEQDFRIETSASLLAALFARSMTG